MDPIDSTRIPYRYHTELIAANQSIRIKQVEYCVLSAAGMVKDLTAGSGLERPHIGTRSLKDIPGERPLY